MIGGGIIKKLRNLFHIPGEDVTLIGFDDRCKSIRIYDMWSKTANKFDNRLEGKTIEGNVAEPFVIYEDKVVSEPSAKAGLFERLGKRISFFNRFVPEPAITHTEEGDVITFTINRNYGLIFKTDDKPKGIAYLVDMQTGQGGQLVPKQIRVERDPVLDRLFSANPFFWGSTIDSFIATELLRGKVEWWKTLLFMGFALVAGLVVGMGM
jgi:hypothetical protein